MSEKTIASIENAIAIIEMAISNDGVTQMELGQEFGWSKTNAHYYVKTLRKHGLLVRRNGEYYAGLGLTTFGKAAIEQTELVDSLATVVNDLAAETGKDALIAVEQTKKIYYIYQKDAGDSQLDRHLVGKARDPHCTAFGKAILASLEQERLEDLLAETELRPHTQNTITSKAELREELETIEENDFAYSDGEFESSIRGIASPIWDKQGETLLGSLGIVGSEEAIDDPYADMKAQRFSQTDANIVKRFAKMARNKIN